MSCPFKYKGYKLQCGFFESNELKDICKKEDRYCVGEDKCPIMKK